MCGKHFGQSVRRPLGCNKGLQGIAIEFMVHGPYLMEFTAQGSLLLAVNSLKGLNLRLKGMMS